MHWTDWIGRGLDWAVRLAPAAALFSLAFVLEGNLRWLGLLGLVPLLLHRKGCPTCVMRQGESRKHHWPTWPGH